MVAFSNSFECDKTVGEYRQGEYKLKFGKVPTSEDNKDKNTGMMAKVMS